MSQAKEVSSADASKRTRRTDLLLAEDSAAFGAPSASLLMQPPSMPQPPKTFRETSSVLGRLQAFLPAMESANRDLAAKMARGENVDIQDVGQGESVIQMRLGLGVTEADGQTETEGLPVIDVNESGDDDDDDDDDDEEEEEEQVAGIQVISSSDENDLDES